MNNPIPNLRLKTDTTNLELPSSIDVLACLKALSLSRKRLLKLTNLVLVLPRSFSLQIEAILISCHKTFHAQRQLPLIRFQSMYE